MIRSLYRRLDVRRRASLLAVASIVLVSCAAMAPSAWADTGSADLATTVAGPARFGFSGYITYRIAVTNHGPNYAHNVVLSDGWSGGWTTFVNAGASAPAGASCPPPTVGSHTVTCTAALLAPGASMTVNVTIHVRALFHNQVLVNTATASSQTFDPNIANNTATVITRGA
jgi:uncharacterized repeat protein (TIGR01451 family)